MTVEIEIPKKLNEYAAKINEIKNKLKDLSKPLTDFNKYYRGIVVKNFYQNGTIFAGGWTPLKKNYLKQKKRMVEKGSIINGKVAKRLEILRLTDTLRKELFNEKSFEIKKDLIEWRLKTIYSRIHQYGGSTGKAFIPARPFLFDKKKELRLQDRVVFYKILEKYLLEETEEDKQ